MLGGAALPSTTQVGLFFFFFFLSYTSDLVIPSTRHFLGSHSVGTSQASANSHRFHSLFWRIHKGIYSTWEASDIALSCERRWEDGWRGWWTQGLTGASRGGNRAWCNSSLSHYFVFGDSGFCSMCLFFISWNVNDLAAGDFLEPSDRPLPLKQYSVASCDILWRAVLCGFGYVWPGVTRRLGLLPIDPHDHLVHLHWMLEAKAGS